MKYLLAHPAWMHGVICYINPTLELEVFHNGPHGKKSITNGVLYECIKHPIADIDCNNLKTKKVDSWCRKSCPMHCYMSLSFIEFNSTQRYKTSKLEETLVSLYASVNT